MPPDIAHADVLLPSAADRPPRRPPRASVEPRQPVGPACAAHVEACAPAAHATMRALAAGLVRSPLTTAHTLRAVADAMEEAGAGLLPVGSAEGRDLIRLGALLRAEAPRRADVLR